jgi:pyruvate dehydrogenase E1 component alpha subunit
VTTTTEGPAASGLEGGADPDAYRCLDDQGRLVDGATCPLTDGQLAEMYHWMLLSRMLDERAIALQRQGRLGTYSAVHGQEASVVGSCLALDPGRDWIVPQYREAPALLRHGYPLERLLLYYVGHPHGACVPEQVKVTPIQISLAAQLPHAVGLAIGLRLQGLDGVVATYFGDGASSEGDFHEACNLAGIVGAPVVFVLQNNGYAISTPRSKQTAAASFACRAEGYGFPGVRVDGNDPLAVYDVTRQAVVRARDGGGPTLIESQTYRLGAHNTADDQSRYVPPAELEQRRKADPLPRFAAYLSGRGLLDPERSEAMRAEITALVSDAITAAERYPAPDAGSLLDHVYATPGARLQRQREAVTARAARGRPSWPS